MIRTLISLAGGALVLASCGQQADPAPGEAAVESPSAAPEAAAASSAAAAKTAYGAGVITAVDPAAGTVTINHEPIKAVNWPAMTMSFKAGPAVIREAAIGDRVQFDLTVRGGTGEITAIYPH
jgi:Cu/Ag efflux protein CusF